MVLKWTSASHVPLFVRNFHFSLKHYMLNSRWLAVFIMTVQYSPEVPYT
jgi:hypothetical protein